MAVFSVKFDTSNAAFDGDLNGEIVRILLDIAARIDNRGLSGYCETIRDINGNDIGRYSLKNDDGTNYSGQ